MSDSLLKRYVARPAEEAPDVRRSTQHGPSADQDAADDFGAFGFLRGVRDRAIMLELRLKDGSITAIGYGYLEKAEYDPSEGIVLHVLGQKYCLKGRNLNTEVRPTIRLFEGITRHKVPWVCEADHRQSMTASDNDTVIDAILH